MATDPTPAAEELHEASIRFEAGDVQGALAAIQHGLDRAGDDDVLRFYLELQRAGWLRETGRPGPAATSLETASALLDRLPREQHATEWSMLRMEQGLVARQQGDLVTARALLAEAAQLIRSSPARDATLPDILANQAAVDLDESRLGEAGDALTAALEIDRRVGNRRGQANDLNMLGLVQHRLGDFETARAFHEQALDVAERHGLVREATHAMVNLASIMDDAGDHAAAEELFRRVGDLFRNSGDEAGLACSIANQGVAAAQAGDFDRAIAFLERSYERHLAAGNPTHAVADQLNLSAVQSRLEHSLEALEHAKRALAEAQEYGLVHLSWMAEYAAASSRVQLAHRSAQHDTGSVVDLSPALNEALAGYMRAIDVIELLRTAVDRPEERETLLIGKESVYVGAVNLCLALGRPREAFEVCERARARSFLDALGSARIGDLEAGLGGDPLIERRQDLVARLLSLQTAPADKPALLDELRTVRAELIARRPALAAVTETGLPTADDIRASVPPDTVVLEFFQLESNSIVVFLLDATGLKDCTAVSSDEPLDAMVQRFRDEIEASDPDVPTGHKLFAALIRPAMPHLGQTARLIVVPHQSLNYLPFSALWFVPAGDDAPERQYLKTRFYLTSVPSSSYLPRLSRPGGEGRRPDQISGHLSGAERKSPALVIGNPTGDLAGAEGEARTVARRLGVTPLLGPAATRDAVLEAGSPRVLHVAGHGQYDDTDPLLSGLEMADGRVTVEDFLTCGPAPDLLVLSGCLTGMSLVRPGDELVGLAQAALRVGTRAVVATLWETFDESSVLFFDHFYEALASGESVSSAMSWARESVARSAAGFDQPIDWAPFVLIGDPDLVVVDTDGSETFSRALRLLEAGEPVAAKELLLEVAEGGSHLASAARYTLGTVHLDENDVPAAVAAYDRVVVDGDPDWIGLALNDLGIIYYQSGDASGARAAYEQAAASGHPEAVAKSSLNLAVLLTELGDKDGARAAYVRSIETGSEEIATSAALRLGMLLLNADPDGAKSALAAAAASPDASVAQIATFNLGVLLAQEGQDAISAFAAATHGPDPGLARQAEKALTRVRRRSTKRRFRR